MGVQRGFLHPEDICTMQRHRAPGRGQLHGACVIIHGTIVLPMQLRAGNLLSVVMANAPQAVQLCCRILELPMEQLLAPVQEGDRLPLHAVLQSGQHESIDALAKNGMTFQSTARHCVYTHNGGSSSVLVYAASCGLDAALQTLINAGETRALSAWHNCAQGTAHDRQLD